MIDLYGAGSPNVVRVFIALEELGLPHQVKPVDIFGGQHFDAEFRKLNPIAKVPVIVDHDGPGGKPYTVFESAAILLYLSEKTGKLLPAEMAAKYDAIQWVVLAVTTLGPMFGQFVHFMRFAPEGNDYGVNRYRTQVHRAFEVAEQRLADHPWLGGADYTIADIAWYPWARVLSTLMGAEAAQRHPRVADWAARIAARPAVAKALATVEEVRSRLTSFDQAAPETLDKLFGRGTFAA
jgi:GST-like protein